MHDEQNPERGNAEANDPPESEREEPAPGASPSSGAPSDAASNATSEPTTSESWLASDRVQALANVLTVIVALTAIGLSGRATKAG